MYRLPRPGTAHALARARARAPPIRRPRRRSTKTSTTRDANRRGIRINPPGERDPISALIRRAQRSRAERLGEEVVCAGLEDAHLAVLVALRRQHDHGKRRRRLPRAQVTEHAVAVETREVEVEHHNVRRSAVDLIEREHSIARFDDGEPLPLEELAQHAAQRFLVLDEQHGRMLSTPFRMRGEIVEQLEGGAVHGRRRCRLGCCGPRVPVRAVAPSCRTRPVMTTAASRADRDRPGGPPGRAGALRSSCHR